MRSRSFSSSGSILTVLVPIRRPHITQRNTSGLERLDCQTVPNGAPALLRGFLGGARRGAHPRLTAIPIPAWYCGPLDPFDAAQPLHILHCAHTSFTLS